MRLLRLFIVLSSLPPDPARPSMARRSLAAGLPAWGLRRAAAPPTIRRRPPAGILPFGSPIFGSAGELEHTLDDVVDPENGCVDHHGSFGHRHGGIRAVGVDMVAAG